MYVYSAQVPELGCLNRFFFGLPPLFSNTTQSQKYGYSLQQLERFASELILPSSLTLVAYFLRKLRSKFLANHIQLKRVEV